MREASFELERVLEWVKSIVNAESEEEINMIKGQIKEELVADGMSEESVESYFESLNRVTAGLISGEYYITENGQLMRNEITTEEFIETDVPTSTNTVSNNNLKTGIAFGLIGSALVTSLALKQKVFNNKKNNSFRR